MTKFAWNEKTTDFFVAGYTACLEKEGKALANSEEFITSLMKLYAEKNDGMMPVSVRSVRQKLASEKVYQKLEANEKPKTERASKGKKINQVARISAIIAEKIGEDEEIIFDIFHSLENASVKTLTQLESVLVNNALIVEDDGSAGE